MAIRTFQIKNILIGRKYIEEIIPNGLRLEIIDRPYYRYLLAFFYAGILTYILFSVKPRTTIFWSLLALLIFAVFTAIFINLFTPKFRHRIAEIGPSDLTLSPGLTFLKFSGKIKWSGVKEIEIIGYSGLVKAGIYSAGYFYKFKFKNGKYLDVHRVFSPNFHDKLLEIARRKKIVIK